METVVENFSPTTSQHFAGVTMQGRITAPNFSSPCPPNNRRDPSAMDRFSSINVFIRAAETRSFTAAARLLGMSASAVGKAISRLESRLAVRLFNRSTRTMTLTLEGTQFLQRCLRIADEINAAEAELAMSHAAPRGRLRVSLPMTGTLLMPLLSAFITSYPDVKLDLDFSDRQVDVIDEGFDIVLKIGHEQDSQLTTKILGSFSHVIVGTNPYFSKHGIPREPEHLLDHACLLLKNQSTGKIQDWELCVNGTRIDLMLRAVALANTIEPLISMAQQGVGLACVPRYTVRQQLEIGSLKQVLGDFTVDTTVFRAIWPHGRDLPPKSRAFVDFVSGAFPQSIRG